MQETRWMWGILLLSLCCSVADAAVDLKNCGDCSNRDDVPCDVQEIPYPCPHAEFRDQWPGPPRALKVHQLYSGDEEWPYLANFTWEPPYDASISSLTGFFLTVNMVISDYGVMHLPKCFFANLSGTDWSVVKDPYSVVFHFDCVKVQMKTKVHMLLNSSPMPAQKSEGTEANIMLELGTSTPVPPKFNISQQTRGSNVKVEFGPIAKDMWYTVCLSTLKSEYRTCSHKVNVTESPVEFSDVNRDNYTIMIRAATDGHFFASKPFFVKGAAREASPPGVPGSIIVIIILTVLIFVTMATTVAFCVMRKQGKCFPKCIKQCKERSIYERTPTNIPNNEGVEVCAICLEGESSHFLDAVSSIMSFLKTHGQCQINGYYPVVCPDDNSVDAMANTYSSKLIVFFHSENMVKFLKSYENRQDLDELPPHKKFILMLLRHPKLKKCSTAHVSFHNHNWAPLNEIKVLNMTKLVEGKAEPDLGINTDDVHELLTKVSSVSVGLTDSWSESLELIQVLTKTKAYLTNRTKIENSQYLSDGCDLGRDVGYFSHDSHLPTVTRNLETVDPHMHHITYRETQHSEAEQLTNRGGQVVSRQVRLPRTEQWAEQQNQNLMRQGCGYKHDHTPSYRQPHVDNYSQQIQFHHKPVVMTTSDAYVRYNDRFVDNNNTTAYMYKRYPREEILRRVENKKIETPPMDFEEEAAHDIEWEPPMDDDTASITFSVICEKQQEVNDHYMKNLMSSGRF